MGDIRLLVPVVILDTLVTSLDLIASKFFEIVVEFEPSKCLTHVHYFLFYIIFRVVSLEQNKIIVLHTYTGKH